MFNIIKSDQRYYVDREWIKGYLTFSFQDYYDEENNDFGNLIVFNEETLSEGKGFKIHPTHDMEIITYIVEGELKHLDDTSDAKTIVKSGEFQILHAGDGIKHSEKNASNKNVLTYLQFWFSPKTYSHKGDYSKVSFSHELTFNNLFKVFGENDGVEQIRQDVNFYMSILDENKTLEYSPEEGRKTFIFLLDGCLDINNNVLNSRDSARTKDAAKLNIKATKKSVIFLVDTI